MLSEVLSRLVEKFGPSAMAEYLAKLLPNLISAFLTALLFYLLWLVLSRLARAVMAKMELDLTLKTFLQTALRYAFGTLGLISALGELGIDTASLIASLGVAGLTLGFAARDTLSNLISGIFIFWDRPFVLGDLIEIDGQYGRVDEITLRSTRIVTVEGKMIALPNSSVINSRVASYTNFPHLRLGIDVTLGVEEDLQRARALFIDLVSEDERFMPEPAPQMVVTALNDYNVAVQCRVWLEDEKQHIKVSLELREAIFELFRDEGIDMPFETTQVLLSQPQLRQLQTLVGGEEKAAAE